ncbi:hypothetical protein FJ364_01150, partial [Candidatus Dependentiae bacterium]|nr:hypothetical protein [Candidatus Dependentiae bacterium]
VGKLIGNHKICPTISPGKSWEGLLGSFIGVVGINFLILPKIEASFAAMVSSRIGYMLAFSAALTVVAFLGGLLLSVLKRSKNLKDAGNVLPGHGGFLDRFDSVFSVILIVWLLIFIPIFLAQSQDFYTLWLRLADSIEMHAKAAMAFIQTSVQQVLKLFKK